MVKGIQVQLCRLNNLEFAKDATFTTSAYVILRQGQTARNMRRQFRQEMRNREWVLTTIRGFWLCLRRTAQCNREDVQLREVERIVAELQAHGVLLLAISCNDTVFQPESFDKATESLFQVRLHAPGLGLVEPPSMKPISNIPCPFLLVA